MEGQSLVPIQISVQGVLRALSRLDRMLAGALEAAAHDARDDITQLDEALRLVAVEPGMPRYAPAFGQTPILHSAQDPVVSRVQACYSLTPFDLDLLLLSLAPEADVKYERVYALLQGAEKGSRPTVELALNLLCPTPEAKVAARGRLHDAAPLRLHSAIHLSDPPGRHDVPLLSKVMRPDPPLVEYLLGAEPPPKTPRDGRIHRYTERVTSSCRLDDLLLSGDLKETLLHVAGRLRASEAFEPWSLYVYGPPGSGKRSVAEALARSAGLRLLRLDMERLLIEGAEPWAFHARVGCVLREAMVSGCALHVSNFDLVLGDAERPLRTLFLGELERHLSGRSGLPLVMLSGERPWHNTLGRKARCLTRRMPDLDASERTVLWRRALGPDPQEGAVAEEVPQRLAGTFRMTGGAIFKAAAAAKSEASGSGAGEQRPSLEVLLRACRAGSRADLDLLAERLETRRTWNDLVLPVPRMEQLRDVCAHVKHRAHVYEEWGFGGRLSYGTGLSVLFSGPPGTGKTLAAEVLARELGIDLYRIDLSAMMSKYIGETEKNLGRLFSEAERADVILFFDEADALFGKRSEVRDAHDRYANVEVSYLLQRIESHQGMVILATNFRKNMDEAFVRRLQFTIEFPFPGVDERRRMWERVWPSETPLAPAVDLDVLARTFETSGAAIRNIALGAAFLAAAQGKPVDMNHLLRATRREYQKMGKVIGSGEFGEYAAAMMQEGGEV